jgi:hypothetical protein
MRTIREVIVRTNYAATISGNERLIARLESADVVKIVDMETKTVLSHENPDVLVARARQIYMQNPRVKILVIPFTPGNNYIPPQPPAKVVLRKAKR